MPGNTFDKLVTEELTGLQTRLVAEHEEQVSFLRTQVLALTAELDSYRTQSSPSSPGGLGSASRKSVTINDAIEAADDASRRVQVKMARNVQHMLDTDYPVVGEYSMEVVDLSKHDTPPNIPESRTDGFGRMQRDSRPSPLGHAQRDSRISLSSLVGQKGSLGSATSVVDLRSTAVSNMEEPEEMDHHFTRGDFEVHAEWKSRNSMKKMGRRISVLASPSVGQVNGGSAAARLMSEKDRHAEGCRFWRRFVILPSSTKHLVWELVVLTFILYDIIVIPLELLDPEEDMIMNFIGYVQRVFWTLDIFKSFLTGILMPMGTVDLNPRHVARRYATTWLPLDIICVTIDWVTLAKIGMFRSISGSLRFLRILRIAKLVRLFKAPEFGKLVNDNIRSDIVILSARIFQNIVMLLATAHFIACLWYAVGTLDNTGTTWVETNHVKDLPLRERYTWSLHWSLAQFSGEMIFEPQNITERAFAVAILFFTFLCSVMFVGSITTCMTQLMILSGKKETQLSTLRRFLADHKISNQLSVRMLRNAQFGLLEHSKNVTEKSVEVLVMISEPLMMELHFELHSPVLMVHRFFWCYNEVNLSGIMTVCHNTVSTVSYTRDDRVFNEYETPARPRMFFCTQGKLHYEHETDPRNMETGQWACEAVLWTRWIHCGNLLAVNESTFHCIDSEKFRLILSPTPFMHVRQYATAFVAHINHICSNNERRELSDFMHEHIENCLHQVFPWLANTPDEHAHRTTIHGWLPPIVRPSQAPVLRSSGSGHSLGSHIENTRSLPKRSATRKDTDKSMQLQRQIQPILSQKRTTAWSVQSDESYKTGTSSNEVVAWSFDDDITV